MSNFKNRIPCRTVVFLAFLGVFAETRLTLAASISSEHDQIQDAPSVSKNICETKECINAASRILNNMDQSVEPCDNFYQFTCGNYIDQLDILTDVRPKLTILDVAQKMEKQLLNSLEKKNKDTDPKTFKLLKSVYDACSKTSDNQRITDDLYFQQLSTEVYGWPVFYNTWNESDYNWIEALYKFRENGLFFNSFFELSIGTDRDNNKRIFLNQPEFELSIGRKVNFTESDYDSDYESDEADYTPIFPGMDEEDLLDYMVEIAHSLGIPKNENTKQDFKDVINFEFELAEISIYRKDHTYADPQFYQLMTIKELESKYQTVPWLEYINKILNPHAQVDYNEKIMVVVPSYFASLSKVIDNTPKRTLANYAMWRVVRELVSVISPRTRELYNKERENLERDIESKLPRPEWKSECLNFITENMALATDAFYIRKHFDRKTKEGIIQVLVNVHSSFQKILNDVDWMDESMKKNALQKLNSLKSKISYPDELLDDDKLDEFYQYMKVHDRSILRNKLSLNLVKLANEFLTLKQSNRGGEWMNHYKSFLHVQPYNFIPNNTINIPYGVYNEMLFSHNIPQYLNYGGIGQIIAHEIAHSFHGMHITSEKGPIEQETLRNYLERLDCIEHQYDGYTFKGENINGQYTLSENIADNIGIKDAYYAYENWQMQNPEEPRLPGLPFTSKQMYWIATANTYCENSRPDLGDDTHSPGEFRIIGTFSNMPDFSKDFNCKPDSLMNPEKKCKVYRK